MGVFISHSHRDEALADAIYDAVEAAGVDCWMSRRDLPHGVSWTDGVTKALSLSQLFVLLLTPESARSNMVARELDRAGTLDLVILAIRVGQAPVPDGFDFWIGSTVRVELDASPTQRDIELVRDIIRESFASARVTALSVATVVERATLRHKTAVTQMVVTEEPATAVTQLYGEAEPVRVGGVEAVTVEPEIVPTPPEPVETERTYPEVVAPTSPPGISEPQLGNHPYPYPYPLAERKRTGPVWLRVLLLGATLIALAASGWLWFDGVGAHDVPRDDEEYLLVEPVPIMAPNPTFKMGSLTVESDPMGATVYLNGKPMPLESGDLAKSPSDLHNLQYGVEYRIGLRKAGYEPFHKSVLMGAESDGTTLRPTLTPHDAVPVENTSTPGCKTDPSLGSGYVSIMTKPYADVYWGQRKLGATPVARIKLPAGCVKLRAVSLDGTKTRTVQINVAPNQVSIYRFDLDG